MGNEDSLAHATHGGHLIRENMWEGQFIIHLFEYTYILYAYKDTNVNI